MREQFPIFNRKINGKDLIYLDNAATTQKPQAVIDAITDFYSQSNANIHRGIHTLSTEATRMWEDAHQVVADFLGAKSMEEIIFVRNATEGLNLVANMLIEQVLEDGDIVVISEMEHHSNIVPWKLGQKRKKFRLEWIPVKSDYTLDVDWLDDLIKLEGEKVKVVSLVHISNVLGVQNPVRELFKKAKSVGAYTILDSAQSAAHMSLNVKNLGADFLVFSGHKVYGPTGSGVLYGKKKLLEKFEPWMGGGEMIKSVSRDEIVWNDLPWKFEAGTPNIAGGVGLAAALRWLNKNVTSEARGGGTDALCELFIEGLKEKGKVSIIGPEQVIAGRSVVAFTMDGIHPHDSVSLLDEKGIALRGGYHCAEPLHRSIGCGPTVRASFALYNTEDEVAQLLDEIGDIFKLFK